MLDSPIDAFKNDVRFRDYIAHVETIPAKEASFKKIPDLNSKIVDYLDSEEIKLYEHQADTYEAIKRDENVILTTTTASGKTLAFNLPIMESLIEDEKATALYIYPAKALSNDQLTVLKDLESDLGIKINPHTYDGDTPKSERYNIRQKSRVILTNPYQLHLILSWHHQWERFYSNLKYIVIDEAHYYRGVFGSNVAFLIRRLKRIANFYGANPQFILSSATLANPLELANKLTGEEFSLVDNDASPSGEKDFILFNPFKNYRNSATSSAPSIHVVTADIFRYLMLKNIQTLCFTVSRKITELIAMWSKKDAKLTDGKLDNSRIAAYRAGYRPEERREIEEGLKSRKYLGVTCTNALELGIDIGSLDAVIISGFPGTMMSTWQQSGRAGRSNQKSLAILLAFENQLDQYYMNNPKVFFDKPQEKAIIDLSNPILQEAHLLCAANELPLKKGEALKYFNIEDNVLDDLVAKDDLYLSRAGNYTYKYDDNPAFDHSLDQISSEEFKVMNNGKLLETMERSQVYREAHEGAILINKGETYTVDNVNLKSHYVNVSKKNVDYHTMVLNDTEVNIVAHEFKKKYGDLTIHFGEVNVKKDYYKYKKMQHSRVLGMYNLNLPPLKFKTKGLWFTIPKKVKDDLKKLYPDEDEVFEGGLHGAEHALIGLFPLQVICDRFDIGGLSTPYHKDTEDATIFIYDGYEGGIGICEKAVDVFVELLKSTLDLIKGCKCSNGCPSCIYSPKCGNDNKPLHKKATEYILQYMLDEALNGHEIVEEEIIEEDVKEDEDLYGEALNLYTDRQYSQAKDILHEILNLEPNHLNANLLMAYVLYEQGIEDVATFYAKKTLKISPSNENAADLLQKLKFAPAKKEFVHSTIEKEDVVFNGKSFDDVDTLYEEAYDLFNQGDLDTARELLEELLAIDDTHVEATALMGFVYRMGGIFPKAVEYARKASKLDKNNVMVKELIRLLS
ncbi:MAG: DEAD/DEAH box helicase [Methanobrevibacter sp.]|nr:DEAD/DEAH box helicase [Methanobrevibacter sp.]